jgi:hypothetical protein
MRMTELNMDLFTKHTFLSYLSVHAVIIIDFKS